MRLKKLYKNKVSPDWEDEKMAYIIFFWVQEEVLTEPTTLFYFSSTPLIGKFVILTQCKENWYGFIGVLFMGSFKNDTNL